jgi:hypothetical protein
MRMLTIEHNHGVLVLQDVTFETYTRPKTDWSTESAGRVAVGTVVSGGQTSRLFHATSYTPFKVGSTMKYDLYGREPYCSNRETDEWYVSCVSCG